MAQLPPEKEMRRAYLESDAEYDGVFYLAVRTTGIFCRPSCRARKPQPDNVEYFPSPKEAVFAGYRPCKRCRPMEKPGTAPEWLGPLLTAVERDPAARYPDAYLRSLGIDPARVRRFFARQYGMTFQAFCRGRRLGRSLEQIRRGADLDDVALVHGYDSHSGFRSAFGKAFGAAPGRSRKADCIVTAWIETAIGPMVAAATSEGICLLEFTDRRRLELQFGRLRKYFRCSVVPGGNRHIDRLKKELAEYFDGTRKEFSLRLVTPGGVFEKRVWEALLAIPYGKTASYRDIAEKIGAPNAFRAVGRANGFNRIAILIPCHRVINAGGNLGGYGGGLWRKKKLLELERMAK